MRKQDRRKKRAVLRQKKHRLKDKEIALVQGEIPSRAQSFNREPAEKRLMDITQLTPGEWQRFLVKKA